MASPQRAQLPQDKGKEREGGTWMGASVGERESERMDERMQESRDVREIK